MFKTPRDKLLPDELKKDAFIDAFIKFNYLGSYLKNVGIILKPYRDRGTTRMPVISNTVGIVAYRTSNEKTAPITGEAPPVNIFTKAMTFP